MHEGALFFNFHNKFRCNLKSLLFETKKYDPTTATTPAPDEKQSVEEREGQRQETVAQ